MDKILLGQTTLDSITRMHEQIQSTYAPLLNYQVQFEGMTEFINKLHEQMANVSRHTLQNIQIPPEGMIAFIRQVQNQMENISRNTLQNIQPIIEESTTSLSSHISLNINMQNMLSAQINTLHSLESFDLSSQLSDEVSKKFTKISENIVQEINSAELLDSPVEVPITNSSANSKLTFQDVIAIIGIIFTLLTCIQGFLPNEHEQKVERYLEQLIDLQTKELELLQQLSE